VALESRSLACLDRLLSDRTSDNVSRSALVLTRTLIERFLLIGVEQTLAGAVQAGDESGGSTTGLVRAPNSWRPPLTRPPTSNEIGSRAERIYVRYPGFCFRNLFFKISFRAGESRRKIIVIASISPSSLVSISRIHSCRSHHHRQTTKEKPRHPVIRI